MEPYTNEQQAIIEKAIRRFLEEHKELVLRRILGPEGLDIVAGTNKDINLRTSGTGKAYYNDVEIGAGGGDGNLYVVKTEGAGDQLVYNEIQMRKGAEIKFFVTTGPTEAGSIGSFVGLTIADLLVLAQTGYLYLQGSQGIRLESTIVNDAAFAQKIYLNAAKTAWIVMNGNILEFHIPGGKWRVVPE